MEDTFIFDPEIHPTEWEGLRGVPIVIDGYYVLAPYCDHDTPRDELEREARAAIKRMHSIGLTESVRVKLAE